MTSHPAESLRTNTGDSSPFHPAASYEYVDALDLPRATSLIHKSESWADVVVEPPGQPRSFIRRAPDFLSDPDNVGLFTDISAAVFSSPPIFVARAQNASLVGFRSILTKHGKFFNDDSIAEESSRQEFLRGLAMPDPLNEETGLIRLGQTDSFTLDPKGRSVKEIPGTTVLLSSSEPSNYGSWLFRVLPKLETLGPLSIDPSARFLVWAGRSAFREYLEMAGVPESRIIEHDPHGSIYQLETLIVPSNRNNQAFLDGESLALYERMRREFGSPQESGKRIYVSRLSQSKLGSARSMENEAELIEQLKKRSFIIVSPEKLPVREQIRIFSSASIVVGPSGSGMFNVVLCHPGTKVIDIESEPHWIHAHLCLFSSCDLRFEIFVGKAADPSFKTHHQPWEVNIEALVDRIEAFAKA